MASITFRLKSSNHWGSIDMKGNVISCKEIREAVAAKISAPPEEICVFMADSDALLHPEEDLPAYAVVDVVRQAYTGKPIAKGRHENVTLSTAAGVDGRSRLIGSASASTVLTEDERLAQLQADVTLDTGIDEVSGRFRRGGGRGGFGGGQHFRFGSGAIQNGFEEDSFHPPQKGYICHNCGKGGHFIQHCPSAKGGKHMKVLSAPIGIPESMLVECTMDDPAPKFITRDHRLVKRRLDSGALSGVAILSTGDGSVSSPTSSESFTSAQAKDHVAISPTSGTAVETVEPPNELLCLIDNIMAKEAMKVPCCGRLMCRSCFNAIVEEALSRNIDDDVASTCPGCGEPLLMDDVTDATKERRLIEEQLSSRKRARET